MNIFEQIAENRIRQAQEEGLFDDIPGKGRPFQFEDDSATPEEMRLCHKLLRNANCLPPEMELRKEIYSLRELLEKAKVRESRIEIEKKLNRALVALGESGCRRGQSV